MRTITTLYIIIILSICNVLTAQSTLNTAGETIVKENIAVLDFTDSANKYRDESKKVRELIENMLVNMKRFNIVDRKNLDKYIEEMKLQYSGLTDGDVVEAGKIQGFNKAVYGSIVRYDVINTPPIIIQLTDGGFKTKPGYSRIDIAVSVKIVDVATTKIIYSKIVSGSGISYVDDFSYSKSESLAQAEAYDSFIANLNAQLKSIFKYNIKIADIQRNGNVILLAGANVGLSKSMRFNVYSKSSDIMLSSGKVLTGNHNKVGSIKLTSVSDEYSIAKINRGNIAVGDIAEETMGGNSYFSIYPAFTAFNVNVQSSVIKSSYTSPSITDTGEIKTGSRHIEYTGGIYFKSGYMFDTFGANFSAGFLFGDMIRTSFGADMRFGFDINVPIYREVIALRLSPFVGVAFTFAQIGTVENTFYTSFADSIKSGTEIWKSDVHLGAGSHLTIDYRPTDNFGISLGIGYKFYTVVDTIEVYAKGIDSSDDSIVFPDELRDIKPVSLTGLEAIVSFNIFF